MMRAQAWIPRIPPARPSADAVKLFEWAVPVVGTPRGNRAVELPTGDPLTLTTGQHTVVAVEFVVQDQDKKLCIATCDLSPPLPTNVNWLSDGIDEPFMWEDMNVVFNDALGIEVDDHC